MRAENQITESGLRPPTVPLDLPVLGQDQSSVLDLTLTAEPIPSLHQPARVKSGKPEIYQSLSIRDLGEFAKVQSSWEKLGAASVSPIGQFIWTRACADSFSSTYSPRFMASLRRDYMAAVAPLAKAKKGLNRWQLIGVDELFEPMDFIYSDRSALEHLCQSLADEGAVLWLRRLPSDSPTVQALKSAYDKRGFISCRPVGGCPYIPLDDSWEEPEQRFNSGRRSDFRRAFRNLEKTGPVTFHIINPTSKELDGLLADAYRVEAAGWKGAIGTALARDEARGSFFRQYTTDACRLGILRLCFLRVAGQAVAMQLAVQHGNRFWLLKIGYDEAFARNSPGQLLMLHTLRYAAREGLDSYEFLGTVAPWTKFWTELERPCVSVRAYPYRVSGLAVLGVDSIKFAWSNLRKARAKSE